MHSNSGRALPGLLAAGHLAAVLLACTRTNPAFEADGGGGSGGATSGDAGGGTTTTGSSGGAGRKFIAGLPRKPATKRVRGAS